MNSKITSTLGLVIAIFMVAITILFLPKINHQPHGIFLPAKTYQPYTGKPTTSVFVVNHFPLIYTKLGTINIEQHFSGKKQKAILLTTLKLAKSIAAKHGATAIVVNQAYFDKPTGVEAGLGALHFQGFAITVPKGVF